MLHECFVGMFIYEDLKDTVTPYIAGSPPGKRIFIYFEKIRFASRGVHLKLRLGIT